MDMDLRGESKPIVVIIGHEVSRSGLVKPRQTCNDHRYDLSIDVTERRFFFRFCKKIMALKKLGLKEREREVDWL